MEIKNKSLGILLILGIILTSIALYIPSLKNGFVNWDDQLYVYENYLITDLGSHFWRIITEPVAGNYHPLTIFSLALDYRIAGFNPFQYHLTNLILHLLNTALAFGLIYKLSNRKWMVAAIGGLLFAIHPMHVEAVAWISARKELLFVMFYLLGMMCYLQYRALSDKRWLLVCGLAFLLSVSSKATAVTFPIALLFLDYLVKRPWGIKMFVEKIPFFIISILVGLLAIQAQSTAGAVGEWNSISIWNRAILVGHSLWVYLIKVVAPFNLTAFHAYPDLSAVLEWKYYAAAMAIPCIGIVVFPFRHNRILIFSTLFFVLNLLLTLQVVNIGGAKIAERYTYLAYVTPFLLLGLGLWSLSKVNKFFKLGTILFFMVLAIAYYLVSMQRIGDWKDGETLWSSAIEIDPSAHNYSARADFYKKNSDFAKAIADLNQAIQLQPDKYYHYNDRGTTYFNMQQYELAIRDFQQAISIKSDDAMVYRNMGSVLGALGRYDESLIFFNRALDLEPDLHQALADRGSLFIYFKNFDQAIADYTRAIDLNKGFPNYKAYNGLGVAYFHLSEYNQALAYFNQALLLNPTDGQTYLNRSQCRYQLGQMNEALQDALKAQHLGFPVDPMYLQSIQD